MCTTAARPHIPTPRDAKTKTTGINAPPANISGNHMYLHVVYAKNARTIGVCVRVCRALYDDALKENAMKTIILAITVVLTAGLTGCTEGAQREIKNWKSEWMGGLNRTATLYSNDGKPIKQWQGKFDMQTATHADRCRLFDVNGKRNVVCGGIFVVEEN